MLDTKKRSIGVNFNNGDEAEVVVWAPKATILSLVIDGEEEPLQMHPAEYGYWKLITPILKKGSRYKFQINNAGTYPDPASTSQPAGVHNSSEAIDLTEFEWTDSTWNNPPLDDYIFYELHTGTFSQKGTFEGIEEKLSYLKELGITAIEIMPIAQFPGERNWGYDGVFPFAVQHSYGGAKALQQLVNACHNIGLAVVLDVVYNHLGPEGNYLDNYGNYFTNKYHTPWGKAVNFDDAWCDGVRHYFIENVLMWFRDFHIDALRLDAVHAIKDFSPKHILEEIKEKVDELVEATGKKHYLIIETDLNDNGYINPIEQHGLGMDAQWLDDFHHALRVTAVNEHTGYYQDFNGIHHLAKSYTDAYVYDGMYSAHRKKIFGVKASENEGKQFVVYSQNHDQVGNRMLGERTSQLVSIEMQKVMAGAVLISPYLPMLFMGEEYGEANPFLYFVNHTDDELTHAVSQGRKKEFAEFYPNDEAPDPNAPETFLKSKLQWDAINAQPQQLLFNYYKQFIALRKSVPALHIADRKNIKVIVMEEQQLLVVERKNNTETVICLLNFSKKVQAYSIGAVINDWVKIIDSASAEWNGPGEIAPASIKTGTIVLQPESIVLYQS